MCKWQINRGGSGWWGGLGSAHANKVLTNVDRAWGPGQPGKHQSAYYGIDLLSQSRGPAVPLNRWRIERLILAVN